MIGFYLTSEEKNKILQKEGLAEFKGSGQSLQNRVNIDSDH